MCFSFVESYSGGSGVGGVSVLEVGVLAGEKVGESFGGLATAAAGGRRPEAAAVHMVAEGKAFVV